MAQPRHGRSGGRPSVDAGLPSWAQRHLDEAGDTAIIPVASAATRALSPRRQHRAPAAAASGLRGWGVAIVSVAAAVGAVPLAVSTLANDHSGDPLPKVDTYTAGRPGPLQAEPGSTGGTRSGTAAPQGDPATAGVLEAPSEAPVARAPIAPRRTTPVPAAVVRTAPAVVPPVAPRTATSTTPTSTTQERSATTPTKTTSPTKSTPKSAPPSGDESDDGGSQPSGGLLSNTVGGVTHVVDGAVNGLLNGG
jgi:hypothetical protein